MQVLSQRFPEPKVAMGLEEVFPAKGTCLEQTPETSAYLWGYEEGHLEEIPH